MSDVFNHELDAWESYGRRENGYCGVSRPFADKLFFHTHVEFIEKVRTTEKAILLKYEWCGHVIETWFPLKWIRHMKKDSCYVWSEGYTKNSLESLKQQVRKNNE